MKSTETLVVELRGLAQAYEARERRQREIRRVLLAIVLWLVVMLLHVWCSAQSQESTASTEQTLMIVVAHEAGLGASIDEVSAIHQVLTRRAEQRTMRYTAFARVYSRRLFRGTSPTNRWALSLRQSCTEPAEWPQAASWSRQRADCEALAEHVRRVVSGEHVPVCTPDHWGGPMDRVRAQRLGLRPVDCGETANDFWVVP